MKSNLSSSFDLSLSRNLVKQALAEDLQWGDITTDAVISSKQRAVGEILSKSSCVLAGLEIAMEAFRQLDSGLEITQIYKDGDSCECGNCVVRITGSASALLNAERTALNFLQRMSGIATLTRSFVDAADGRVAILDTRKTTPMLRMLDKYSVRVGGGINHRFSLGDGILIKDNHIRLAGSVEKAIKRVRKANGDMRTDNLSIRENEFINRQIEVEVQSMVEVKEAIEADADCILLDNFSLKEIQAAVRLIGAQAKIEISGGVTLNSIKELALTGASCVSVGALTHSAPAIDFSFELYPIETDFSDSEIIKTGP